MNNKGFTLVELLAVIVMLVGISLTAVMGISASLERRDEKECNEQIQLAINTAKIYFSLNNVSSVTIDKLKEEDYFSSDSKVDRLSDTDTITFNNDGYVFTGTKCEGE